MSGADEVPRMRLSIVIPCWNDAAALRQILATLRGLRGLAEVIVADASHTPDCGEIAAIFGARLVRCEQPNRGAQMNAGAAVAGGDVLLFHHADSQLTQRHVDSLLAAMENPDVIGGAFFREFDARHPRLRWLEFFARWFNQLGGTLYGDQSLFVRREHFEKTLRGFAEIPLMEDIEFSRRLRRSGRTIVLDPPLQTSARRHEKNGSWKTTVQNGWLIFLYRIGVSPWRLHRIYYGQKRAAAPRPVATAAHLIPE